MERKQITWDDLIAAKKHFDEQPFPQKDYSVLQNLSMPKLEPISKILSAFKNSDMVYRLKNRKSTLQKNL